MVLSLSSKPATSSLTRWRATPPAPPTKTPSKGPPSPPPPTPASPAQTPSKGPPSPPPPTPLTMRSCNARPVTKNSCHVTSQIISSENPANQEDVTMGKRTSGGQRNQVSDGQEDHGISPAWSEPAATKTLKSLRKTEVRSQHSSTSGGEPNPTVSQIHEIVFETQRPSSALNPTTSRKRSLVREAILKFSERGGEPPIKNS